MNPKSNIVSNAEWLKARKALLAKEKAFTKARDELSHERASMPWTKVEKNYIFDGPNGKETLASLFGGRSQLIVYHFMFAPEWSQGCKSCSLLADHYDPSAVHLEHRDTTLVTVARAPFDKLRAFRDRMGWKSKFVSSFNTDFNRDFAVHFTEEELASGNSIYNYEAKPYPITDLPGMSVFFKDKSGQIYHTYSTYARGLDQLINVYNLLDLTPKGRDEEGMQGMDWLRHKDRYDDKTFVDPWNEKKGGTATATR